MNPVPEQHVELRCLEEKTPMFNVTRIEAVPQPWSNAPHQSIPDSCLDHCLLDSRSEGVLTELAETSLPQENPTLIPIVIAELCIPGAHHPRKRVTKNRHKGRRLLKRPIHRVQQHWHTLLPHDLELLRSLHVGLKWHSTQVGGRRIHKDFVILVSRCTPRQVLEPAVSGAGHGAAFITRLVSKLHKVRCIDSATWKPKTCHLQ
mmetsp:Transcript_39585/g.93256  ORF Transcript_39585/g.93256 Transcript_39585/m.93256 type:complete len:204 (-) Transcript_39585:652-1263(-)